MRNIYDLAVQQMPQEDIDHHESDLYLRVTPVSKRLIEEYEFKGNVTMFIDQIDHVPWYEVPFAYAGPESRLGADARGVGAELLAVFYGGGLK